MEKLLKFLKKEKLIYLGVAFLLFFIPSYPKFPLFPVSETYVHIRLEDIFVALLVGIFALQLILRKDFSLFKRKITQLIILYFLVGLLSILSAIFITKNITPHLAFFHWLRRVEYISLLFVTYYSFNNLRQLRLFGWSTIISTILVIGYGLGQKFYNWPVVSTMNKEFSKGMILRLTWWARVNSTFAGHYDLAAYFVMILALVVALLSIIKNRLVKLVVIVLGLFSYYLLILTASRISFAAYLIAVLFVLFLNRSWKWIMPFIIFSLVGMVLSGDLGQRYAATFKIDLSFLSGLIKVKETSTLVMAPTLTPTPTPLPVAVVPIAPVIPRKIVPTFTPTPTPTEAIATASAEYFESTALAVGRSTDIRFKVEWPRAMRAFLKNPLLGTGYSSITLATDNDYLRMLGETGILGTLAFGAIILEILRKIYFFLKNKEIDRERRVIILGTSGAAIGYFLNATFIDVFEASKIAFFFWIMMGLTLRIIDLRDKEKQI